MMEIFSCLARTEDDMTALAVRLADRVGAGDTLLLSGAIGAGKSVFARSLIQTLLHRTGQIEDVPSPTFTIVQRYAAGPLQIVHADLYRLKNSVELDEIALIDDVGAALVIVEWPALLPDWIATEALSLFIAEEAAGRRVTASGAKPWAARLAGFETDA